MTRPFWLRRWFVHKSPAPARRRPSRRLTLEALENRLALSTFNLAIDPASKLAGADAELISAINTANSNGQANTINLAAGVYTLVSVNNVSDGANGLPVITSTLTIKGAGPKRTIVERSENSSHFRIFKGGLNGPPFVQVFLTLDGLTARGGNIDSGSVPNGGGVNILGGLTVTNAIIEKNAAVFGGGISIGGSFTVTNSIVSGYCARANPKPFLYLKSQDDRHVAG